eukprot:TRINITY_DN7843_c0_g1_i1.p1 TRINITY_DN7843_c0_g1~~TRINITY_DN7843_c0_g1_i1.p1  ORF type:complete len:645 (+),score=176.81 TRINITY_DN7843_c0_g1_i1:128-1936(+)
MEGAFAVSVAAEVHGRKLNCETPFPVPVPEETQHSNSSRPSDAATSSSAPPRRTASAPVLVSPLLPGTAGGNAAGATPPASAPADRLVAGHWHAGSPLLVPPPPTSARTSRSATPAGGGEFPGALDVASLPGSAWAHPATAGGHVRTLSPCSPQRSTAEASAKGALCTWNRSECGAREASHSIAPSSKESLATTRHGGGTSTAADAAAVFDDIAVTSDGRAVIDFEEFRNFVTGLRLPFSKAQTKALFLSADCDADAVLCRDEWMGLLTGLPSLRDSVCFRSSARAAEAKYDGDLAARRADVATWERAGAEAQGRHADAVREAAEQARVVQARKAAEAEKAQRCDALRTQLAECAEATAAAEQRVRASRGALERAEAAGRAAEQSHEVCVVRADAAARRLEASGSHAECAVARQGRAEADHAAAEHTAALREAERAELVEERRRSGEGVVDAQGALAVASDSVARRHDDVARCAAPHTRLQTRLADARDAHAAAAAALEAADQRRGDAEAALAAREVEEGACKDALLAAEAAAARTRAELQAAAAEIEACRAGRGSILNGERRILDQEIRLRRERDKLETTEMSLRASHKAVYEATFGRRRL